MTRDIKQIPWWKWTLLLIGAIVLALIGYALIDIGYDKACELQHPSLQIITVVLVLGIYALIRGFKTDLPTELRLGSLIPHTLLGLVIGFVYVTLVVSTLVALGYAYVSRQSISWNFYMFYRDLGVAVAEVIIFLGVIFRMIDERWNTTAAFIVSALAFTIAYRGTEPPIVMGLMFAAAYKWKGTLWLPIGFHWAWNYMKDSDLCGTYHEIGIIDNSVIEPIYLLDPPELHRRVHQSQSREHHRFHLRHPLYLHLPLPQLPPLKKKKTININPLLDPNRQIQLNLSVLGVLRAFSLDDT